jgi:hypothetical protein
MKITKRQLRKIIKEEYSHVLSEQMGGDVQVPKNKEEMVDLARRLGLNMSGGKFGGDEENASLAVYDSASGSRATLTVGAQWALSEPPGVRLHIIQSANVRSEDGVRKHIEFIRNLLGG